MREHAHYFRVSYRERENHGLAGGARGIRNIGVARSLSEGKRLRKLRIFGVEIDQHPPENEFAVSSIRFPSLTLEFRGRGNAAGLTTDLRGAGGLGTKRARLVAEKRRRA